MHIICISFRQPIKILMASLVHHFFHLTFMTAIYIITCTRNFHPVRGANLPTAFALTKQVQSSMNGRLTTKQHETFILQAPTVHIQALLIVLRAKSKAWHIPSTLRIGLLRSQCLHFHSSECTIKRNGS